MPTCSNCGTNVPLRKSLSGRPLKKQDRECPDCGKELDSQDDSRPHMMEK